MPNRSLAPLVLHVDDDRDTCTVVADVLNNAGFRVQSARDGDMALRLLREGVRPSVILTDLVMPELDGWQLIQQLEADASLKTIPVIVLSGHGGAATIAHARAHLAKPVRLRALVGTVGGVLGPDTTRNVFGATTMRGDGMQSCNPAPGPIAWTAGSAAT